MKVLFVSHLFPNRAEPLKGVFVGELARMLARRITVEVLAPVSWFPFLRPRRGVPLLDDQGGLRVHHPRYLAWPAHWAEPRWRSYHRATRRFAGLRQEGFTLMHALWIFPDAYAALHWAQPAGWKAVATIHGHEAIGQGSPAGHRKYYQSALSAMVRLMPVSGEIEGRLHGEFGVTPERTRVIHNGVDLAKFQRVPREEARRTLGLPVNQRVLLAVARLSEEKRLPTLIAAARRCGRHDWQLYIVGEGPLRGELERGLAADGLENRVHLLGGVPHAELRDWYCAADAFCLSSDHEGCPVVILEALACGLPVVATRVGAVPDLLNRPELGLLCPPNDTAALAECLDAALSRNWDAEAIASHGRRYTWDAAAEKTLAVYQEALG